MVLQHSEVMVERTKEVAVPRAEQARRVAVQMLPASAAGLVVLAISLVWDGSGLRTPGLLIVLAVAFAVLGRWLSHR